MKNAYLNIRLLVLMFASIVAAPGLFSQTTIDGSFLYSGANRTYRLYIPASYNPAVPVPLLFNLHGYGSNNTGQEFYADFRPIADTASFIIALPNGTYDLTNRRFWNTFNSSAVDDIGFLSALIDTIRGNYSIDTGRIYSTGMSNGGFMSYELACFLSGRIAAVASVTGSMIWPRLNTCNATHPTPVMQIHGTADLTVPYNGNSLFAHIDTVVSYWVQHNNCQPQPEVFPVPDINTGDNCTAVQYIYRGGTAGTSVEFFKVMGGGHSWPGAPINLNITNMDFSACVEIWRFFRQYSLHGLIAGNTKHPEVADPIKIFPNPAANTVNLRFSPELSYHDANLMIYNMYGSLVYSANPNFQVQNLQLDISDWPAGFYMIRFVNGAGYITSAKLIVL